MVLFGVFEFGLVRPLVRLIISCFGRVLGYSSLMSWMGSRRIFVRRGGMVAKVVEVMIITKRRTNGSGEI